MNKLFSYLLTAVITAILVGGGVYLWQNNKNLQTEIKNLREKTVITVGTDDRESQLKMPILTKEYLVSGKWGQQTGSYGQQIKFNQDGTFSEIFAGETDFAGVDGVFQVKDNKIILKVEKYGGLPFEEARKSFGFDEAVFDDRELSLRKSSQSLFFKDYLFEEKKGEISFWNHFSKIDENDEREFGQYVVVGVSEDLMPKSTAKAKSDLVSFSEYSFERCDPNNSQIDPFACDVEPHKLGDIVTDILARTQVKGNFKGEEDYWYLASVSVPWYSVALLNGVKVDGVSLVWLHGSELQK